MFQRSEYLVGQPVDGALGAGGPHASRAGHRERVQQLRSLETLEVEIERRGLGPFGLLCSALNRMVAAGALAPARRPGAEFLAWSAVHGLAMLAIEGPLSGVPEPMLDGLSGRLLEMVEHGL